MNEALYTATAPNSADTRRRARFDRLCVPFRADLLRFAIWLTRDTALAEDVVQNTMIRAWNHLDTLQDEAAVRGWILTIARREVARAYQRKSLDTVDIDNLSPADTAALAFNGTPEIYDLRKAIWSLPVDYREPLVLQVMLGFTTQEIATQLGVTRAAVLTRLFRAREKLRDALAAKPEDGRS